MRHYYFDGLGGEAERRKAVRYVPALWRIYERGLELLPPMGNDRFGSMRSSFDHLRNIESELGYQRPPEQEALFAAAVSGDLGAATAALDAGADLDAWNAHGAAASEAWPSVTGEITLSDVTHSVRQSSSGGNKWRYIPRLEYRYEIDGAEFTNDNIQFVSVSWEFKDRFKAERVTKPYPVGRKIDVFYDPEDPEESVLQKGSVGGAPWGYIIGSVMLVLGVVLVPRSGR
jgi:hypothetical protein